MASAKPRRRKSVAAPVAPAVEPVAASGAERREATRVPILTQVEAQAEKVSLLGRAKDISIGGLLIETPDTLTENAAVVVRFFIPPDRRPVEAVGRVVRVVAGKSMGINFLGLADNHRQTILDYVRNVEGATPEAPAPVPASPQRRRSGRLRRHVMVGLSWQDEAGRGQQEMAETQLLSQHGFMVSTFAELKLGQVVHVMQPHSGRGADARVVLVTPGEMPGMMDVAIEFAGVEDFWGQEFPPADAGALPEAAQAGKRRGRRVEQRVTVLLHWQDEWGREREESAQTRNLSRNGAQVSLPAALAPGQRVRVRVPERNREAVSRIIWSRPGEAPGQNDAGIEFIEVEDFWDQPGLSAPAST